MSRYIDVEPLEKALKMNVNGFKHEGSNYAWRRLLPLGRKKRKMSEKYREILKLYIYCDKTGVECRLEKIFDGYAIRFNNGGDFIQHHGSYGCDCGCVEPAIGSRLDYTAVPLQNAIALVRRHKDKLNKALERNENEA